MAAEPNRPKTGTIAFVTALSVILVLISVMVIEGLFYIWHGRAQEKAGSGDLTSQLAMYTREQQSRLTDIDSFKQKVLAEARTGKSLAAPIPPAVPTTKAISDKVGDAKQPMPAPKQDTSGKPEPTPIQVPGKKSP